MSIQAAPRDGRDSRLLRELWLPLLVGLAAFRILVPLVVVAAAPDHLPLLPGYDGVYLNGDANGFYQAVSAVFAAFRTVMYGGLGVVVLVCVAGALVGGSWFWRRGWRAAALLLPAAAASIAITLVLRETAPPGAAVIGWPLVWAAALFPLPAVGLELTPDRAFPIGLALGLLANGVTTVATAVIGLRTTGRRSVGLAAAGLYAMWPVWVGLIAGHRAWENGQWNVETGLHLYTEPLSTMLMVVAVAMLLGPDPGQGRAAGSGLALGFATVVKLTNGLIGLVLVPLVALRYGLRKAVLVAAGGLVSLPILIAWWPKGYVDIYDGAITPPSAYSLDYIGFNLRESTIFTPLMLFVLVLPAVVGVAGIDGWFARSVLVAPVFVTALAYSAYFVTNQHPRFFYVALPFVFVLVCSGARILGLHIHHLLGASRSSRPPAAIGVDNGGGGEGASLRTAPPSGLEDGPALPVRLVPPGGGCPWPRSRSDAPWCLLWRSRRARSGPAGRIPAPGPPTARSPGIPRPTGRGLRRERFSISLWASRSGMRDSQAHSLPISSRV